MKLKTTKVTLNGIETVVALVQDDKPVYVHDDGKDVAVDVPANIATISRLSNETKTFRERAEGAESKLKSFEGITSPAEAIKAIETLKNIDEGKLLSAGKVEEIKSAAKRAAEEQVAAANKANAEELAKQQKANEELRGQLDSTLIGGGFARSKMITDPKHPMSLVIPADIAEARFGKNFKVDNGRPVGHYNDGNPIYSKSKPGEIADFDEALEILVDHYPNKDQILRGTGNRGDSARGSNGNGGGQRTISRVEFDKLGPLEQRAASIGKDAMTIVD